MVGGVAIAPDGTWLTTASRDGSVRLWNRASVATEAVMRLELFGRMCQWGPDCRWLAICGAAGLYLFDVHTQEYEPSAGEP